MSDSLRSSTVGSIETDVFLMNPLLANHDQLLRPPN